MTRTRTLVVLLCALLFGCSDDDRVAGGSGTHLPKPTARLLDTNLQPLHAEVWRLWRVDGDQAIPTWQFTDPNGFEVPDSGLWIVEAWRDTTHSGFMDGLGSTATVGMDSCIRALTYLAGTEPSRVGVVSCQDLVAPTRHSRSNTTPLGVGVFGARMAIQQIIRVPTTDKNRSDAFRFMVFRVDWSHGVTRRVVDGKEIPSRVPVIFDHQRISAERGLVDIEMNGRRGDWLFVGWGAETLDSFWLHPQDTIMADSIKLSACKIAGNYGACKDQPFLDTWPSKNPGNVHFVVGLP